MSCTNIKAVVQFIVAANDFLYKLVDHCFKCAAAPAQYHPLKYSIRFVFIQSREGVANVVKDALIFATYNAILCCKCYVDIIQNGLGIVRI